MDVDLGQPGQKDRTRKEQAGIEKMIQDVFDEYNSNLLNKEDLTEDDDDEYPISHFLLKDFHGQYMYFNLMNMGNRNKKLCDYGI